MLYNLVSLCCEVFFSLVWPFGLTATLDACENEESVEISVLKDE